MVERSVTAPPIFTNREKARAAQREVGKRKRVYPGLVANRGFPQADADREIAIMQEIANDYDRLADADAAAIAPRLAL